MYDQSFTKITLEKSIKVSDYFLIQNLPDLKEDFVNEACQISENGYLVAPEYKVTTFVKKNKTLKMYGLKNFPDKILIRKITNNLRIITQTKQQNRNSIVKNLKLILSEGVDFKIYRRDIKDFYGSLAPDTTLKLLEENWHISKATLNLTRNILSHFKVLEKGLPRTIGIFII